MRACSQLPHQPRKRCRVQAQGENDQRLINLMRQSHVMPFTPLPHTGDPQAEGALFAVLQPIDAIADSTLQAFEAAHELRAEWRQAHGDSDEQPPSSAASSDVEADNLPRDPRHAQATARPAGQVLARELAAILAMCHM